MVGKRKKDLMRVGITGHQVLGEIVQQRSVRDALETLVSNFASPLVAVTSLAAGADQMFTRIMVEHGASIDAVIPFEGYERTLVGSARNAYFEFLSVAADVVVLPRVGSDEECFFEAGKTVVRRSDLLVAVWDGKPARGVGGTADVVKYARDEARREIRWINPAASAATAVIAGKRQRRGYLAKCVSKERAECLCRWRVGDKS